MGSGDKGPGTTNISCAGGAPPSLWDPSGQGQDRRRTRKGLLGTLTPPQEMMMVCLMGLVGT